MLRKPLQGIASELRWWPINKSAPSHLQECTEVQARLTNGKGYKVTGCPLIIPLYNKCLRREDMMKCISLQTTEQYKSRQYIKAIFQIVNQKRSPAQLFEDVPDLCDMCGVLNSILKLSKGFFAQNQ